MNTTVRWLSAFHEWKGVAFTLLCVVVVATAADRVQPAETKSQREPADSKLDPVTTPPVRWLPPAVAVSNATARTTAEMKPYQEIIPDTPVTFDMVPIPGGRFLMGSPASEPGRAASEGPQRTIEVEAFWMGKCEVTCGEFSRWVWPVREAELDARNGAPTRTKAFLLAERLKCDAVSAPSEVMYLLMRYSTWHDAEKELLPAISMSQLAAKMYCKWLSAKTGRYYRLPTEAEWEYACRAGTTTAYSFGDGVEHLDECAWYTYNSDFRCRRVGTKQPNPWGLHDMHGNAAEWVLDQFTSAGYADSTGRAFRNPVVVPTAMHPRVIRGGSWDDDAKDLRSAARRGSDASWQAQDPRVPKSLVVLTDAQFVGFRVVRPLRLPSAREAAKYDLDDAQLAAVAQYRKWREQWSNPPTPGRVE